MTSPKEEAERLLAVSPPKWSRFAASAGYPHPVSRNVVIATVVVAAVVPLTAWAMDWPLERAVYLAPVLVAGLGAVAGLLVLWARAGVESFRASRRPWLLVGLGVVVAGLIVGLSLLGVKLPRE